MFKTKFEIFILTVMIFIIIGWNEEIVPVRVEVTDIEPIRVIGFDYAEDKNVILGALRENVETSSSSSSGEKKGSSEGKEEAVIIKADSFERAMRGLQSYTSKQITGDHVKYIFIGERMARESLFDIMDFLTRDEEFRFNSFVYILKDETLEDFFTEQSKSKDFLADKLNNMEKHINDFGYASKVRLINILDFLLQEDAVGLIPVISLVNKEDLGFNVTTSTEGEGEKTITFSGYSLIKGRKLAGYLQEEISRGYNILQNNLNTSVISIEDSNGEKISLDLQRTNAEYKFEFDNNTLKKATIDVIVKSNYSHISDAVNVYQLDTITTFEKRQSDIIKGEISKTIAAAKEQDTDFIRLKEKLELKHPYKYKKIEDKWSEIFKDLPIEINVKSEIERTYDVWDKIKR